jgi:hypothetical protein
MFGLQLAKRADNEIRQHFHRPVIRNKGENLGIAESAKNEEFDWKASEGRSLGEWPSIRAVRRTIAQSALAVCWSAQLDV